MIIMNNHHQQHFLTIIKFINLSECTHCEHLSAIICHFVNKSAESTVKGVVRLMLSFWKGLPNCSEPTLNGSKEFQTYMKAILYRWIVFTIIDLLFCVIIIVLLVIAFQIYTFKGQGPNGILYPKGIQYPNSIPYIP